MEFIKDLAFGDSKPINLSCLNGFIGQDSAIKKIRFFAESCSDETPFPTLLLTGSHGLGKTFLAEKIANTMARNFISVNCGSIKTIEDFIHSVIVKIDGPTTIFLDESHSLSSEITTILLTLLNPTEDHKNEFSYKNFRLVYDLRKINMIFATTDAHMMFRPLNNRCYKIYFSPYKNDELIDILNFYLGGIKLFCNLDDVADACRSRARDAFLLSQNIKRYSSVTRTNIITTEGWNHIKETFDIYPKGLNREEVDLLQLIRDCGPISCANLALRLMVNENNIKSEIEVRLRELGLIESSSKGRQITESGINYFQI